MKDKNIEVLTSHPGAPPDVVPLPHEVEKGVGGLPPGPEVAGRRAPEREGVGPHLASPGPGGGGAQAPKPASSSSARARARGGGVREGLALPHRRGEALGATDPEGGRGRRGGRLLPEEGAPGSSGVMMVIIEDGRGGAQGYSPSSSGAAPSSASAAVVADGDLGQRQRRRRCGRRRLDLNVAAGEGTVLPWKKNGQIPMSKKLNFKSILIFVFTSPWD